MIPVLSCADISKLEQASFGALNLPSRMIMESAGRACVDVIVRRYANRLPWGVVVVCGRGNNGGDGYVVARTLLQRGVGVAVVSVVALDQLSADSSANCTSFQALGGRVVVVDEHSWQELLSREVVESGLLIDALFGTGFRGELRGFIQPLCQQLNHFSIEKSIPILSIDVPSGVDAQSAQVSSGAIEADSTVTFQALKPGLVVFPGSGNCGDLYLADIGISLDTEMTEDFSAQLVEMNDVRQMLQEHLESKADAHKGTKGYVAIIGGSEGHFGAPKMSGKAALRTGSGRVTLALPRILAFEAATQLLELMSYHFAEDCGAFEEISAAGVSSFLAGKDAVVIGPGIGNLEGSKQLLSDVLKVSATAKLPVVIDADALNCIAQDVTLLKFLSPLTVLTPHPGEMARLLGCNTAQVQQDRFGLAQKFAQQNNCWLVLKGARSVIAAPSGELWLNPGATAALATAGSGDVLAGIIASFLGQGFAMQQAVLSAVFLHGAVGEYLEAELGNSTGIIAGDIIDKIPFVISEILSWHDISMGLSSVKKVFSAAVVA